MRNSEVMFDAQECIDEVIELIGDEHLYYLIDEPIQKAATEFKFNPKTPIDHQFFIRTTSDFVSHIYRHGLRVRQTMTAEQAQSEALLILEHSYQGTYSKGYDAAYLDASNPEVGGLEFMLSQTSEIIISNPLKFSSIIFSVVLLIWNLTRIIGKYNFAFNLSNFLKFLKHNPIEFLTLLHNKCILLK